MAKEIGNLYYTIGVKGERDAKATLARVQDAISKSKRIDAVSGVSMAKPSEGASASAAKDARVIAAREAKRLGFELGTIVRDVRAITKAELAALHAKGQTNVRGAFSPSQKVIAVNRTATERTVKHELIHAIDAAIGGGKLASTIQGHLHNRLAKAFAPVRFREIIESESFSKMDQKRKNAYLKYSMLPQELFVNLMERQSDEFKRAVFGTGIGKLIRRPTGKILQNRRLSDEIAAQREREADERFLYKKNHYATDSNANPFSRFGPLPYSQQLVHDEREQLRQERIAARSAQRGALGGRLQQGMGLPIGTIGGSQSVFGVGAKPQSPQYSTPLGPPLPPLPQYNTPLGPQVPKFPAPWLYRINSRMTELQHELLAQRADEASSRANRIRGQVMDYGINRESRAQNVLVNDALRQQRSAVNQGQADAANENLRIQQNRLLDIEERKTRLSRERLSIEERVNSVLGTSVLLEERIRDTQEAAIRFARNRQNGPLSQAQINAINEQTRQEMTANEDAHGGTLYGELDKQIVAIRKKRQASDQYVVGNPNANAAAIENNNLLRQAEVNLEARARNELRMAEMRNANGGNRPVAGADRRVYRQLERDNARLGRQWETLNERLHGISAASRRWNYQLLELGYGVQDFTQVLAGGGGLSAALRGASNNLSQFFAAGGGKNAALWATGIGVGALAIGMMLDSITKQSKEAAENLDTVRKSADRLSTLNLKVLSGVNSASLNTLNPDIMGNRESGAFNRRSGIESASAALDEIRYQNKTSSIFTPIGDFVSAISANASGFFAKSRGLTYYNTENEKGRFSNSAEIRDAEEVLAARISGRQLGRNYRSGFGSDLGKMDIDEALEKLAKSGSLMADPLRDAYNKKKEGESQKRISDFEFNENMKNYKTQTSMWSIGSGRSENARAAEMLAKRNELEKRNEFLRNEKINNKMTPESKAAYSQEIRRNQERIDAINERRKKTQYSAIIASVNGQGASGMSMESALDEYLSKKLENKLANVADSPIEASVMEAAMRQVASSYNPSQMQGESLADFNSRVVDEMNHQFEMLDIAAKESGRNLDQLKDRIGSLGRVAIDIAKAMEARDKAVAGTVGMDNYSSDEIKQVAAVEEELAKKKAENEKKYFNTDKTLMHHLDAVAEEEADRSKNRIRIQRVQSEFADKTMMAGNVASFLGGREGVKLNTEMEYDQRIAAIEASNLDRAQKDSAIGVAKDLREAELEKIDRKNVSFTDVGSMWKTIQGSLQNDNKKILSHWKTYMDLVKGEGIRVKLNIGT